MTNKGKIKQYTNKWSDFLFCDVHKDGSLSYWTMPLHNEAFKNIKVGESFTASEVLPLIIDKNNNDILEVLGERLC